jgi:hypothetical protein
MGVAHEWIAWIIIVLATGHALAALFRHFVLRDDVLWRMLPGLRPGGVQTAPNGFLPVLLSTSIPLPSTCAAPHQVLSMPSQTAVGRSMTCFDSKGICARPTGLE